MKLCKNFINAGIHIEIHLSFVKGTVVATDIIIARKVQYQRFLTYICHFAGRREVEGCALVCKCMWCSYCYREGSNSCLTHKRCSTPNTGKSCRMRYCEPVLMHCPRLLTLKNIDGEIYQNMIQLGTCKVK